VRLGQLAHRGQARAGRQAVVVHGGTNALDYLIDQRTLGMVGIELELHGAMRHEDGRRDLYSFL